MSENTKMDIPQEYLRSLVEISQQINSIKHPDELLENTLDIALQQLSSERGFILLRDDIRDGQYIPRVVRNIDSQQVSEVKDISHSTVEKVLETGQPILTFDALSDERFDEARSVIMHQIRSIACVPLLLKGERIGVIYIDSRGQKARFTRQSLDFLQAFANQAAIALENARLVAQLQQDNELLKEEFHRIYAFKEIIGKSKAMEQVFRMMGKVLNNDITVLLLGETGTGKELVARAIHHNGWRKQKRFVPVNCGAIPENLIESELFGHKKGAFTGAVSDKKGLIETAHGGTLFLDEVGELPLNMQVKFLRFLQDKQFTPVGEVRTREADVRIVAATNQNLEEAVHRKQFREDLFYRLNVIHIRIPPLRERKKDIPILVQHFLSQYSNKLEKPVTGVNAEAMERLMAYHWPGNVRELENTIERAVVMATSSQITDEDLMLPPVSKTSAGIEAGKTLQEVSRQLLEKTLETVEGNKTKAAEMMGVSLRWIHYKMKEWGLN